MKTPSNFEPTPELQIFADGRIVTGRKSDKVKEVEGVIDLVELQPLLTFIVNDCKFFEISSESVKADLARKRVFKVMDAGTTKVEVNLKDHSNKVEVYALQVYAPQHKDVPSIASMVAITSRCRHLASKIKLGSEEEAGACLTAANKALAAKSKKAPSFTLEHLQFAEQFVDGKRTATFVQSYSQGKKNFMAFATFEIDAKGVESTTAEIHEQTRVQKR